MKSALLILLLIPFVSEAQTRITAVDLFDQNNLSLDASGSPSIDTQQDQCNDPADPLSPEPFHDTIVRFTVVNESNMAIRAIRLSYLLHDASNHPLRVRRRAFFGRTEILPGTGMLTALIFHANEGRKFLPAASTPIDAALGFRDIEFRIRIRYANRRIRQLSIPTAASFGNFNRCQ